jgi:tetratricopeptide (TPR) repeat protein
MVGYKNLGDLYYEQLNNVPEALKYFRRAAELLDTLIEGDPKNVVNRERLADTMSYIASSELFTGKPVEARRDAKRSLEIAKEVADLPNANPDQIYTYAWLAVTTDPADLRDPKGALPYAKRAVELRGSHNSLSLHVLAQAYAGVGDYARAEETELKALAEYAPVKPGDRVPVQQKMMEDYLKEISAGLKKSK